MQHKALQDAKAQVDAQPFGPNPAPEGYEDLAALMSERMAQHQKALQEAQKPFLELVNGLSAQVTTVLRTLAVAQADVQAQAERFRAREEGQAEQARATSQVQQETRQLLESIHARLMPAPVAGHLPPPGTSIV